MKGLIFFLLGNIFSWYLPVKKWIHYDKQSNTINFSINNEYHWEYSMDKPQEITNHYFYIVLNKQLVKVYLPKNITINKIDVDFWKKTMDIHYTIDNKHKVISVEYDFLSDISLLIEKILKEKTPSSMKELLERYPEPTIFIKSHINPQNTIHNYNLQNFFQSTIDTVDNNQKIQYSLPNKNLSLEINFDKLNKIIKEFTIFYKNKPLYQDYFKDNPFLRVSHYPHDISLDGGPMMVEELNKIPQYDDMEVIITPKYFHDEKSNSFFKPSINIQQYATNCKKPYLLLMIPIELNFINDKIVGFRSHLFPLCLLLEKFHDVYILKKIIINNTCIPQHLFLNGEFDRILSDILTNSEANLKNKIKKNIPLNNLIIDRFSYKTNGNTYVDITDFFQMRQFASYSCYSSTYKDMFRLMDYIHHKIHNKPHFLDNYKINIKDLIMVGRIFVKYNLWNKTTMDQYFKNFIINYETQKKFHGINEDFVLELSILGPKSFGPLQNPENNLFYSEKLPTMEKLYNIFFIKINNEIFSFLIVRKDEDKLDNKRYFESFKNIVNKYYPHMMIHPLKIIHEKDFNNKWNDFSWNDVKNFSEFKTYGALKCLYTFLLINLLMPDIYLPLRDLSTFSNYFEKDYYYFSFYLKNIDKSIAMDTAGDNFFSVITLLEKSKLNKIDKNSDFFNDYHNNLDTLDDDDLNDNKIKKILIENLLKKK